MKSTTKAIAALYSADGRTDLWKDEENIGDAFPNFLKKYSQEWGGVTVRVPIRGAYIIWTDREAKDFLDDVTHNQVISPSDKLTLCQIQDGGLFSYLDHESLLLLY
jgi:hypothetical protein